MCAESINRPFYPVCYIESPVESSRVAQGATVGVKTDKKGYFFGENNQKAVAELKRRTDKAAEIKMRNRIFPRGQAQSSGFVTVEAESAVVPGASGPR